jgi:midasin
MHRVIVLEGALPEPFWSISALSLITDLPVLSFPHIHQEDEEDYHRQFPDQFAHFADLAPDEQPDTLAGASEAEATAAASAAAAAAAAGGQLQPEQEEALQGAAASSARQLVVGAVLQELVAAHAASFGIGGTDGGGARLSATAASGKPGADGPATAAEFLRSYDLGVQLLRAVGLVVPSGVDAATGSGHLYAACCRFRQLAQPPAAKVSAAAAAGVDIQEACIEEAVLVQQPALALRRRLLELLEEWPEHPGLLQASRRCTATVCVSPVLLFIALKPASLLWCLRCRTGACPCCIPCLWVVCFV